MSKTIHDEGRRESRRRTQVKFRCDEMLVDDFDDYVERSDHDSRAEALRSGMRQLLGATTGEHVPLKPPTDEPYRTAYLLLADIANADGVIRHDLAVSELSSKLGIRKKNVESLILEKLRVGNRGYLILVSNVYGGRSWKLNGWDA
jgi:Arc/MetJ-type ribon-helix-helix transcriptional regulator